MTTETAKSVSVLELRVCEVCESSLVRGEGMCSLCIRKEADYEARFRNLQADVARIQTGVVDFTPEAAPLPERMFHAFCRWPRWTHGPVLGGLAIGAAFAVYQALLVIGGILAAVTR